MCGILDAGPVALLIDISDGDVFRSGEHKPHVILENNTDFAAQVFRIVFAQVYSVEQDTAFGRFV